MKGRRSDVRERIDDYRKLCDGGDAATVAVASRKALGDRHYLLVASVADLVGERLLYDLEPDLIAAYRRLIEHPAKRDPGCAAKGAIIRALVALDCQDAGFFLEGIRYRQPEPAWGGTVDTAVDLRISSATGLVNTSYPRALVELARLLHDSEPHVRSGAARAIACAEPLGAEALLRSKVLAGDPEPEVIGDCFAGLLQAAPDESRLDGALDLLREHWDGQPLKGGRSECCCVPRSCIVARPRLIG